MDPDDRKRLRGVLLYLCGICIACILTGLNRKCAPGFLKVPLFDVMQITDTLFMLVFTPVSLIFAWFIFQLYEGARNKFNTILFIMGVYFLGIGFGMHDPFNALHMYKSREIPPDILRSVVYFDDMLGHDLFFIGFMLTTLSVAGAEAARPYRSSLPWKILIFPVLMGITAGIVVWRNMVNENTSGDIAVLLATTFAAAILHAVFKAGSIRRLPALLVLYIAYGGGSLATILHWAFRRF